MEYEDIIIFLCFVPCSLVCLLVASACLEVRMLKMMEKKPMLV